MSEELIRALDECDQRRSGAKSTAQALTDTKYQAPDDPSYIALRATYTSKTPKLQAQLLVFSVGIGIDIPSD